jgi:hypothetical protein
MKKILIRAVAFAAGSLAVSAYAGTEQVNSTSYWVQINPGQPIELPNGAKGNSVMRSHATLVQADGEVASQWCTGHMGTGPEGDAGGAGYCTVISDNGDMLYISYMLSGQGEDQSATWTVMGGTGEYDGATGSGTSENVSWRGDGRAWTTKSTGTLTTK